MKRMTKAGEQKLSELIGQVIDRVDSQGADPTSATVEACKSAGASEALARRACEIYNQSAVRGQIKLSAGSSTRKADAPLVDTDSVIDRLYPKQEKLASVVYVERTDNRGLGGLNLARPSGESQTKVAFDRSARLRDGEIQDLLRQRVDVDRSLRGADKGLIHEIKIARDQVSRLAEPTRGAIVQDVVRAHGEDARRFAEAVCGTKAADERSSVFTLDMRHAVADFGTVENVVKKATQLQERRKRRDSIDATLDSLGAYAIKRSSIAEDIEQVKAAADGTSGRGIIDQLVDKEWQTKQALIGIATAASTIGRNMTGQGGMGGSPDADNVYEDLGEQAANYLSNDALPRTTIAARNLRYLLKTDDVIGSYQPDEVRNAFVEVAQLSPNAALTRPVLRDMLRRSLAQGGLTTHDASQLEQVAPAIPHHPRGNA